jgi:beta-xylosidase
MKKLASVALIGWLGTTLLIFISPDCRADIGNHGAWGDQGDGTYKNPILPGDFSDPDVIRVGSDYYLITSTFQYSPGMAVMQSKDLVNWKYIGHCVDDLTQIGPELNWDRMNRYNRGIYAGALRYHDGKFWMFFTTMDEGVFLTTATNAAGPWSSLHRVWDARGWDDPCPLWNDDGQAYLLLSQPGSNWWTHLFKMSADGKALDLASDVVVDKHRGSEGNKIYKFDKTYFIFHNQIDGGGNRTGVMMRSTNLYGSWEKKLILQGPPPNRDREPNQGGLVQTEAGDWWFITHQGRGGFFDGRPSSLLPVKWVDGWPIPGEVDTNTGAGTLNWSGKKPINGFPVQVPQSSDEFSSATLAPQWEWNFQPRADKWSLTERPGWLRLHAFKPIRRGDFFKAGNTLTQRVMGYAGGEVILKLDASKMADGQTAGLCVFWKPVAMFGVVQQSGVRRIQLNDNGTNTPGPELKSPDVWLKAVIDDQASCSFAYSLDGKRFEPVGGRFLFGWANYRGTRVGIYCWNDEASPRGIGASGRELAPWSKRWPAAGADDQTYSTGRGPRSIISRDEAGLVDVDFFRYDFKNR